MLGFRPFSISEHTAYRFGFNGMEKDDEVKGNGNSLDFGARIYDPRIGRWLSTDSHESEFPSLSTYNFANNAPIFYVDADGNVFVTYIEVKRKNETTGELEKVNYKVVFDGSNTTMQAYDKKSGEATGDVLNYTTGTSQFVDDMVTSYSYIVGNGADVDGAMKAVAEMKQEIPVISSSDSYEYDPETNELAYDFSLGLKVKRDDGTKGGQSPALGFWSEVYHAYMNYFMKEKLAEFKEGGDTDMNGSPLEEEYIHTGKEQKVIEALKKAIPGNKETYRDTYGDGFDTFKADSPTDANRTKDEE